MITLLARKSQGYIGNALGKYDLTAAEQPFFMALQHYEGLTQEELTSLVCVDKAVTTRVVKALEEKGYLIRVQDKEDRRQNRIYPTEKTRKMAPEVRSELWRFNELLTNGIDRDKLEITYEVLRKMEENFTQILSAEKTQGGTDNETRY